MFYSNNSLVLKVAQWVNRCDNIILNPNLKVGMGLKGDYCITKVGIGSQGVMGGLIMCHFRSTKL